MLRMMSLHKKINFNLKFATIMSTKQKYNKPHIDAVKTKNQSNQAQRTSIVGVFATKTSPTPVPIENRKSSVINF